ncbi:MAG: ATP-binding cassette domain-containing protein [Eubacteriales bacterium]|nr:ATP-binding cassette domain-containing protein [Eubacteriales bacterium]
MTKELLNTQNFSKELLKIENLSKQFIVERDFWGRPLKSLTAVNQVSLSVKEGTTLGIVGESGCGKSTLGRCAIRLLEHTAGQVIYRGQNISALSKEEMTQLRRQMQIIFQDPYSSLNPRMTVYELIKEPLDNFKIGSPQERQEKVYKMMEEVSLRASYAHRYPHEFSGGQRQRITIARALILEPEFVVCDEPVSALDVSVQSQVLNLMRSLQKERNLTYLFISHNLSVVKYVSDEIVVMYLGRVVEKAPGDLLFTHTLHPYSQALISAIPVTQESDIAKITLSGEVPSPLQAPSGCCFHTRCSHCTPQCETEVPELREIEPDHFVACHLFQNRKEVAHV